MEKFQVNSNRTKNQIRMRIARLGFTIEQADDGLEYAKRHNPISFEGCVRLVLTRIYYAAYGIGGS